MRLMKWGDKLTADDYISWANEYRQELDAVEHRIRKAEAKSKKKLGNIERTNLEKLLSLLYSQRIECLCFAVELEERARAIREKEG